VATYKIIGDREVAGKQPGSSLSDKDLEAANIPALIAAGHLEAPKSAAAEKQETE
jgi:hypothetical protein